MTVLYTNEMRCPGPHALYLHHADVKNEFAILKDDLIQKWYFEKMIINVKSRPDTYNLQILSSKKYTKSRIICMPVLAYVIYDVPLT